MVGGPFVFFITLAVYFPVIYIMANSQYEPGWIEGVVFLFPLFILFISISLLFPINIIGFFVLVFTMANNAYKITLYELFEKSGIPKEQFEIFYDLCDYNEHERADRHTLEETCRIFSEETPCLGVQAMEHVHQQAYYRRAGLSITEWNSLDEKSRALVIKLFFLKKKLELEFFNEEEIEERNRNEIMDEEDETLFSVPLISKVLTCRRCGSVFYGKGVAGRVVKGTAGDIGMGVFGTFFGHIFAC